MGSASCAWTPDRHEVSLFADRALAKSGTRPHHSGGAERTGAMGQTELRNDGVLRTKKFARPRSRGARAWVLAQLFGV
jgi:hypothetical protein